MAEALALYLKQLDSFNIRIDIFLPEEHLGDLLVSIMNHLRKMMVGYENEEVQALLEEIHDLNPYNLFDLQKKMPEICEKLLNIKYGPNIQGDEIVLGFDDEVETLLEQLTRTSSKQLQIICIAGMAGLGKTTLARKLYKDPLIEYMFDIRAWTCVSQEYAQKDLLLDILSSFIDKLTDEIYKMSNKQLREKLYRLLKCRKYLVVFDDIWDCMAWEDLKMYFPDDKTGSRVLFTSRDIDVSKHVHAARPAHVLRLRTVNESWDIFLKKVYRLGICPPHLKDLGLVINKKCEGLPLAIVIAAGLLKNNWSNEWWEKIAWSLSTFMVSDPSQYMDSLAISYNHLPRHLKPCFLFFGSFPEDCEVPVTKIIWLWIAQGFIHPIGSRILEDVAEDFVMDLIKRSLLMTSKWRADGKIKSCRMHDLLRDFCLRKAEEDNFSLLRYKNAPILASSTSITDTQHEMSLDLSPLPTRSALIYPFELGGILQNSGSVLNESYKSLAVLDMESLPIPNFPSDVIQLVSLRYLAIQAHDGSPRASILNLVNLQMLIILSRKNALLPKTIWKMVNLRHLYIKSGENLIEEQVSPSVLAGLQTLSQVSPQCFQNVSPRTPNLRKLGFCGPLISSLGDLEFPNIRSLQHLNKLKLLNTVLIPKTTRSCNPLMFPENLKKLTMSNTGMDWEEMWTFAWLPNLEVLKLKFHACIGEKWEPGDANFGRLKVLKMDHLDLKQWVSSVDNFPRLQQLVVRHCSKLNSIPLDLGKILTLEVIEVIGCSSSVYNSALEIQKQQESEGNFFLKVRAKSAAQY